MATINEQQAQPNSAAEALNKKEAFLTKNKKAISIAVIAIIAVIVGVLCYNKYVAEPREAEASTELAKGQEFFASEMYDIALKGDSASFSGLLAVAEDYSGTKAANLANLYAGLCYANLNKWDAAITYLDSFSTAGDIMISPASVAALGNAYAHVKQYDKAVASLKKAAKMADSKTKEGTNSSLSPTFLIQAGEILESQNKSDEALKLYEEVKAKYSSSYAAREISKYIERAKAK